MAFTPKPHHHKNARAVLGLIIVLLAFGILGIFMSYQDNIINSDAFRPFIALTAIGLILLVVLLFLANKDAIPSYKPARVSKPSKASKVSKKKKRKSR